MGARQMDKKQWYKILGKEHKEINSVKDMITEADEWGYFYLTTSGHLVDKDGYLINKNFPRFRSEEEAEKYLEKNDIRGNVVGILKGRTRPKNL